MQNVWKTTWTISKSLSAYAYYFKKSQSLIDIPVKDN